MQAQEAKSGDEIPTTIDTSQHANQNNKPQHDLLVSTSVSGKGDLGEDGDMQIPSCHQGLDAWWKSLQTATTLPPVTRSTLSELDLNWIMHNISLRVDVNYDHDLHFKPIQGPSGEQKR